MIYKYSITRRATPTVCDELANECNVQRLFQVYERLFTFSVYLPSYDMFQSSLAKRGFKIALFVQYYLNLKAVK